MYTQSTSTRLAAVILIGLLCTALSAPSVRADDILNSSFEVDPPGTEKDDITDWDFEMGLRIRYGTGDQRGGHRR